MNSLNSISADKLVRLIGLANSPAIIDVRTDDAFAADPRLIPGAIRRPAEDAAGWAQDFTGQNVIAVCREGHKLSHGAAAWLRLGGADVEVLDGGAAGWASAGLPMVPQNALPQRDTCGRTVWVTRSRPKVDRIA